MKQHKQDSFITGILETVSAWLSVNLPLFLVMKFSLILVSNSMAMFLIRRWSFILNVVLWIRDIIV